MDIEKTLDKTSDAKKIWSDLKVSGTPWRVLVVSSFASLIAVKERDYLLEQVALTPKTKSEVIALNERIVDYICQHRLDTVLLSAVSAMTSADKTAVAWMVLVKVSQISSAAVEIAPDVLWSADGQKYELVFPSGIDQSK